MPTIYVPAPKRENWGNVADRFGESLLRVLQYMGSSGEEEMSEEERRRKEFEEYAQRLFYDMERNPESYGLQSGRSPSTPGVK